MSKRKTIKIEELKDEANKVFRDSQPDYVEGRLHIASFVTTLLMNAGQYKGFRYLEAKDLPEGVKPGIIFDESPARNHKYPDDSRISFY